MSLRALIRAAGKMGSLSVEMGEMVAIAGSERCWEAQFPDEEAEAGGLRDLPNITLESVTAEIQNL